MYVLGIDAGGTKTVGLLADGQGTVIGEARGGGANLQAAGELEVEKVLHHVMDAAIGDRDVRPDAICLGSVLGAVKKTTLRRRSNIRHPIARNVELRTHCIVPDLCWMIDADNPHRSGLLWVPSWVRAQSVQPESTVWVAV